jgi:hypothetical protein
MERIWNERNGMEQISTLTLVVVVVVVFTTMSTHTRINTLYALYWDVVMDWGMMQNPTAIIAQACVGTTTAFAGGGGGSSGVANYDPIKSTASNGGDDNHPTHHHRLHHLPKHQHHHRASSSSSGTPSKQGGLRCHHLLLRPRLRFGLTMSALIVLADAVLRFSWLLRFVSKYLFVSHDAFVLSTQFLEVFRRAIWNLLRVEWENIKQKSKQLKARDSLSDTEEDNDLFLMMDSTGGGGGGEQEMVGLVSSMNKSSSSISGPTNKTTGASTV